MKYVIALEKNREVQAFKEVNRCLALHGLQLNREDYLQLKKTLINACQYYEMIETSGDKIFQFIELFQHSPYACNDNFEGLLENVIYLFYSLRSVLSNRIDDEEILEKMYRLYIVNHGVLDKKMRYEVAKYFVQDDALQRQNDE